MFNFCGCKQSEVMNAWHRNIKTLFEDCLDEIQPEIFELKKLLKENDIYFYIIQAIMTSGSSIVYDFGNNPKKYVKMIKIIIKICRKIYVKYRTHFI